MIRNLFRAVREALADDETAQEIATSVVLDAPAPRYVVEQLGEELFVVHDRYTNTDYDYSWTYDDAKYQADLRNTDKSSR